jgi:hypothetical protein
MAGMGCCARAASGQAAAEPTIPSTKSRRRIAFPKAQDHADCGFQRSDYSRDLRPAKWGSEVISRSSNSQRLMSALGHSRPSHFVPVLNNVRYASDSDHSRYESELTLWAINGLMHRSKESLYSITSSAIESKFSGTSMPSALAVVRLMTRSNLFDCSTGSSAGLAPLRMLPV